ncbi:hypothetical protein MHLP_03915 [Candidatus Mycoplasma haematolamae str. Purdue]|uniref:Lipoprotein n=1 Tax=Mycoplasma haematolamae (strain Purdue) TaxID=1212765 RepID=I7BKF0_MYCHA|nr:hypothetical protein [Candidatus Mycoplasma haematolamae]AFO52363.1 hypothetical protein MHLP_03915 [Candidatus Mycoplasma haematolamae str. Purdue]
MGTIKITLSMLAAGGGGSCLILNKVGYFGGGGPIPSGALTSTLDATQQPESLVQMSDSSAGRGGEADSVQSEPAQAPVVDNPQVSEPTVSDSVTSPQDNSPSPTSEQVVAQPGPVAAQSNNGVLFQVALGEQVHSINCEERDNSHLTLDLEGVSETKVHGKYSQWRLKCGYSLKLDEIPAPKLDSLGGSRWGPKGFKCELEDSAQTRGLGGKTYKFNCREGETKLLAEFMDRDTGDKGPHILLKSSQS